MLNLIKAALESANEEQLRINKQQEELETEQLLEFASMFPELGDLTMEGDAPSVGEIQIGMQRPHIDIPLNDDIELEALEINVGDGRVIGIPSDASVQESAEIIAPEYSAMKTFSDFYEEAAAAVTRFPREPQDKYEMRINEYAHAEYAKYEAYCFQEGIFGHGKIDIGDPSVPTRLSMNFGPRNPEKKGDANHVVVAKILYQTDKRGRITKKQLDTANIYNCPDYPAYEKLYDPFFEAVKNRYKVPKNKSLWDVANIKNVAIPVKPADQWVMYVILETDFSNEKLCFQFSIPIKKAKRNNEGEIANIGAMMGNTSFKPGFKMIAPVSMSDFRTASEVRMEQYEMNRPSRFGRFYDESISLGGDEPNPTTAEATPTAEPAANAAPADANAAGGDATATPAPDNAENVDVNDVSAQIADNVANNADQANAGDMGATDLENMPEPADGESEITPDPSIDNVGEVPPTDDLANVADPTDVTSEPGIDDMGTDDMGDMPTDDTLGGLSDEEMNNMSIEELIERGSDKLKSMSINQLKSFLSTGEMPTDVGSELPGDDVQEAAFVTKKNIKKIIDDHIKCALGILNDVKKDFQTIVKDFKAEAKKFNKVLHKACKMDKVFSKDQIDALMKLNHAVVDLASYIEANNTNESYTNTVKRKIKEFSKCCKDVAKFVDAKVVNECGDSCGPDVEQEADDLSASTAVDTSADAGSALDSIEGSDLGGVEVDQERTNMRPRSMTKAALDDFSIYQAADHEARGDAAFRKSMRIKPDGLDPRESAHWDTVDTLNKDYARRQSDEADAIMGGGFKSAAERKSHKPMDKDTRQAVVKKAKEDLDPKLKHSDGRPVTNEERERMMARNKKEASDNMRAFRSQYDTRMSQLNQNKK